MQRVVSSLLIAARAMAILAVLTGLAAGLLANVLATLVCVNSCPSREGYFSNVGTGAARLLLPCVVLAALALGLFQVYCLVTRQLWRTVVVLLFFVVGGLISVAALNALMQYGRATLPIDDFGILIKDSALAWAQWLSVSLLLIAVVWSGGLACLEWGRRWDRLVAGTGSSLEPARSALTHLTLQRAPHWPGGRERSRSLLFSRSFGMRKQEEHEG